MSTPTTCISVWLKWNPRLQVFPHASATDSINIRDCKFLAPATNLASASDSSSSQTASLQQPAAASSTVASNLLRATKKLSYGSSLREVGLTLDKMGHMISRSEEIRAKIGSNKLSNKQNLLLIAATYNTPKLFWDDEKYSFRHGKYKQCST